MDASGKMYSLEICIVFSALCYFYPGNCSNEAGPNGSTTYAPSPPPRFNAGGMESAMVTEKPRSDMFLDWMSDRSTFESVEYLNVSDPIVSIKASALFIKITYDIPSDPIPLRRGNAMRTHECGSVTSVPGDIREEFNLGSFYQQYTHAYDIPVLGSSRVSAEALKRACYTLRFVLASHSDVREKFYKRNGRVMIMAGDEVTNQVPEYSFLGDSWNTRARGLGATPQLPLSSGAEENVLCWHTDRYSNSEDIFLHELAHGVHLIGAANNDGLPGWDERLKASYLAARGQGTWNDTYAATNYIEYFAEGVQSFFNANTHREHANGIHNHVSTRDSLREYDATLHDLIAEIFPCNNTFIPRCEKRRDDERNQELSLDCNIHPEGITGGGETIVMPDPGEESYTTDVPMPPPSVTKPPCVDNDYRCSGWAAAGNCGANPGFMHVSCRLSCGICGNCRDSNQHCRSWANIGECSRNPAYMLVNCKLSCDRCPSDTASTDVATVGPRRPRCHDKGYYCMSWARTGQCYSNPGYMLPNCPRSCNYKC